MVAMDRKGFISVYPTHLSLPFPICSASACHMCNRATPKEEMQPPQLHTASTTEAHLYVRSSSFYSTLCVFLSSLAPRKKPV